MTLPSFKLPTTLLDIKVVIAVVIMIVGAEIGWAFWYFHKSNPNIISPQLNAKLGLPTTQTVTTSTLSLKTITSAVKVGDKFTATITADSTRLTDGFDIILTYDPKVLTVVNNPGKGPVLTTNIYNSFPLNKLDDKVGKIYLSGLVSKNPVVAKGDLGTIQFQARASGSTVVSFAFTKGATNDTNITETRTSKDILDSVNNLQLEVQP